MRRFDGLFSRIIRDQIESWTWNISVFLPRDLDNVGNDVDLFDEQSPKPDDKDWFLYITWCFMTYIFSIMRRWKME